MPSVSKQRQSLMQNDLGVIYRTVCQNPGCGHAFDLNITSSNLSLLSTLIACPRCRRPGGQLKSEHKLGRRVFQSRLIFQ